MTVGKLNLRMALMLALGILVILLVRFGVYGDKQPQVVVAGDSIPLAEKRLARVRQLVATISGKETVLKQVTAEMQAREKGIIQAATAAQAQAQLLETLRRIGKDEGMDVRGAEELRVRPLANDYGEVSVAVSFTCRIEQLVNFLAALANETELLAPNEIRISTASPKDKTMAVRLGLSGVVPRKLVPEKKGISSF